MRLHRRTGHRWRGLVGVQVQLVGLMQPGGPWRFRMRVEGGTKRIQSLLLNSASCELWRRYEHELVAAWEAERTECLE